MNPVQKAAILLASLDTPTADRLLDKMDAELAQRLRNSVLSLDHIPAEAVREVLAELAGNPLDGRGARPETGKRGKGPHVSSANATHATASRTSLHAKGTAATTSFHEDQPLLPDPALLQFERPQTIIALIAASPAARARQYMDALPVALQADVVHRLAKLGQPRTDVILEVLAQLEERWQAESRHPDKFDEAALDTVRQLLPTESGPSRTAVLEALARMDADLAERLGNSDGMYVE